MSDQVLAISLPSACCEAFRAGGSWGLPTKVPFVGRVRLATAAFPNGRGGA